MDFEQIMADAPALIIEYGIKLALAIAIYVVGKWIAGALTAFMRNRLNAADVDATVSSFAANLAYAGLLIVVIIAALGQLGVQTASFVAIIGAAGLAIGFALQGTLSNFAAGVLMLVFRPCKVGDFIEAGGVAGVVEEISVFSTLMRSGDNKTIIVPNSGIMGGNIVNYSTKPTRRVDLVIGVSYDADIKQVKDELTALIEQDERMLKDPEPTVAVLALADSSVNFAVRPWVNSGDYWPVYFDLQERVKIRFDELGIGIPYPQMDIHMQTSAA